MTANAQIRASRLLRAWEQGDLNSLESLIDQELWDGGRDAVQCGAVEEAGAEQERCEVLHAVAERMRLSVHQLRYEHQRHFHEIDAAIGLLKHLTRSQIGGSL